MSPHHRRIAGRAALAAALAAAVPLWPGLAAAQETPAASAPERVSRLGGRAYLGRNAPVVGATVLVQPEGRGGELYLTSTDEGGVFRVDGLADGSYSVRVEREGLAAQVKTGVPLKFPFRAVVELAMDRLAPDQPETGALVPQAGSGAGPLSLKGRVIDVGGGPVGEAQLRFVRLDGGEDPRGLRSRPDGSFELEQAGSGVWRLEVGAVGYLSQRMALDLHGAETLHVILVRQPPDYDPTPLELMPAEQPIPPPGLAEDAAGREGGTDAEQVEESGEDGS